MSNFFNTAAMLLVIVWSICVGVSFIAALNWDGIIEAKYLKYLVPTAIVVQVMVFLLAKLGNAVYCNAFSSFAIAVLNIMENGYAYIYLALALAAMFGMMQRYHRD